MNLILPLVLAILMSPIYEELSLNGLNFNIPNITVEKTSHPIYGPGEAHDWGTEVFQDKIINGIASTQCQFHYLNFARSTFRNVVFDSCNFEHAVFESAIFHNVTFRNCCLNNAIFEKATLHNVDFVNSKMRNVSFLEASLDNVEYQNNELTGSYFISVKSKDVAFENDLTNVIIEANQFGIAQPQVNKPIIVLSWNNHKPGQSVSKIMKKLLERGAIVLRYSYLDSNVNLDRMQNEWKSIHEKSVKDLISDADENSEIGYIRNKARLLTRYATGIVIPGGEDVHPSFYGQAVHPKTNVTDDVRRDLFEFSLLKAADEKGLPLLAVCRGMQISNVWYGGTLKQHVEGHQYVVQDYQVLEKGNVCDLSQNGHFVGYAFHHQVVEKVGEGLHVVAKSQDGTIKALEGEGNRFLVLVQWHPEYKGDRTTVESAAIDDLLSQGNDDIYSRFIETSR